MHELSVAMDVVERVVARANGARISRITLEVGVLSCVSPHALSFCFEVAATGTLAEGAHLDVYSCPGKVTCRACQRTFELDSPYGGCACGSVDLEWQTGRELTLKDMEVDDSREPRAEKKREVN